MDQNAQMCTSLLQKAYAWTISAHITYPFKCRRIYCAYCRLTRLNPNSMPFEAGVFSAPATNYAEVVLEQFQSELNESQMAALQKVLCQRVALVQGPPGTGKTYLGCKVKFLLDTSWATCPRLTVTRLNRPGIYEVCLIVAEETNSFLYGALMDFSYPTALHYFMLFSVPVEIRPLVLMGGTTMPLGYFACYVTARH